MITLVLLLLIYIAFISLGLPDSILGAALPALRLNYGLPLSSGGIISMIIVGSTILSSFTSSWVINKLGTGKIVFLSCLLTGTALLGFSLANSFLWLLILAVPLGLGGGSVDAALNNYVSLHYKAHHMNWLHSFWGIGATMGPVIMAFALTNFSWRAGYRIIAIIQLSFSILLFLCLPLWKKVKPVTVELESDDVSVNSSGTKVNPFKVKGVKLTLSTMMIYCAIEASIGLWGSSYLIQHRGFDIDNAASWMAFYYGGITAGRFISGFVSFRLSNRQLIRAGMIISLTGILILTIPVNSIITGLAIVLTGLGLSPIFPSMLHETPNSFGRQLSQTLIGYQIGFAGIGSALLSPSIGLVLQYTSISLFPVYITGAVVLMFVLSEFLAGSLKNCSL